MQKYDINKITSTKHNDDKIFYVIIAKGTEQQEEYIGHIFKNPFNDWDMKVICDINNTNNPFKYVIIKYCDDVYLLNDREKKTIMI